MGYDPEIVGSRMNPDLTPEMEREVAFFKKWGYLVVEAAITPDQIEDLRAALDRTFALHECVHHASASGRGRSVCIFIG
jgi:hypothetical protein